MTYGYVKSFSHTPSVLVTIAKFMNWLVPDDLWIHQVLVTYAIGPCYNCKMHILRSLSYTLSGPCSGFKIHHQVLVYRSLLQLQNTYFQALVYRSLLPLSGSGSLVLVITTKYALSGPCYTHCWVLVTAPKSLLWIQDILSGPGLSALVTK